MEDIEENIKCEGFLFVNNFDSANLAKVENVEIKDKKISDKSDKSENDKSDISKTEIKNENNKNENNKALKNSLAQEPPSYEFNLWTKQDCQGTEYQNNNKTWFYFGIRAAEPGVVVKLNLVNLNKQVKMFSQGMSPVYKVVPGHPQWDRIRDKPLFIADDKNNQFILSFNFRTPENRNAVTYFAFTYPFSYTDLQTYLKKIDTKMTKQSTKFPDDIYYHRECAIKSLEGRRLDVLTISSFYNILQDREAKIKDLFPEVHEKRPFKFRDKKIIFMSARVHPGETPSSFVLNGFIQFLLNRDDQIAITLRRLYVFKFIPMLNPDGVAQGYYRMDTRGINLNRLYLNPSKTDHPTIYAARALLRYYHNSYKLLDDQVFETKKSISTNTVSIPNITINSSVSRETNKLLRKVTQMSVDEKNKFIEKGGQVRNALTQASEKSTVNQNSLENVSGTETESNKSTPRSESVQSGLFLYIDFHGHASKKGIFIYGNHFDDPEDAAECMLFPKLMSINNSNFHFTSCNFAEKNMYCVDKRDGMSREGSGRVAVYKLTGLVHSYTLECNYNTGRLVNTVPARIKETSNKLQGQVFVPPKYSPVIYEEVGAALGPSILDLNGSNPNSRLPNSQYRSLKALKTYLKLISTNHYQTQGKPLNKNGSFQNGTFQEFEFTDIAALEKSLSSPASTNKSERKASRQQNSKAGRKKTKKSRQLAKSSVTNGNPDKSSKNKVIVSKIISTHVKLRNKPIYVRKQTSNSAEVAGKKEKKVKSVAKKIVVHQLNKFKAHSNSSRVPKKNNHQNRKSAASSLEGSKTKLAIGNSSQSGKGKNSAKSQETRKKKFKSSKR
ncbi:cytosolic carboxypeptidase-like protein 5 isoform X2 [Trichogramma pretiosum]|uniref:cytosolic carboxypeptidase-like protein 5 isoform X2 n=1 Tax=Trichogramma pretiosum TaxID=7493 RepID=UPI000C71ABA8|nr:cytosolic carboxypeptidase-like protein 5 isoform X2 [Trichogramma pretiosum]